MEVHAHSHTPRRKWTHYFWEFLMLFLAVFCGFLAEYQLERTIEKHRAHQYIESFYEDLQSDTAEFSRLIVLDNKKLAAIANASQCYDTIQMNLSMNPCLSTLFWNTVTFPDLIYSDRTIQQLKNAGGMRLMKKDDADSILAYDHMLRRFLIHESSVIQERQTSLRNLFTNMLDYKNINLLEKDPSLVNKLPMLFTKDKEKLNRLFMEIYMYDRAFAISTIPQLHRLKERATGLLGYFREKYHLE